MTTQEMIYNKDRTSPRQSNANQLRLSQNNTIRLSQG